MASTVSLLLVILSEGMPMSDCFAGSPLIVRNRMVIPESIDFRLLGFVRRKPPSLPNLFITLGSEAPEADQSKKKLKNRAVQYLHGVLRFFALCKSQVGYCKNK